MRIVSQRLRRAAPAATASARVSLAGRADADRHPRAEHRRADARRSGADETRPLTNALAPGTRNRQDRPTRTYISNTRALMTTSASTSPRSAARPAPAARRLRQGATPGAAAPAERVATVNGKPISQVRVRPVRRQHRAGSRAARSPRSRRRSCSISSSACSSRPKRPRRPASTRIRRSRTSWRWRA